MKYCLKINRVTEAERGIECILARFTDGDYLLHLNALIEDISNIQDVAHATQDRSDCVLIETSLSKESLLNAMEVLFKMEHCFIRYDNLSEL